MRKLVKLGIGIVGMLLIAFNTLGYASSLPQKANHASSIIPKSTSSILAAEQAFIFSATQQGEQLVLHWQIAPGYYLYRQSISITANEVQIGELSLPTGEMIKDEFFGDVAIFKNNLTSQVDLAEIGQQATVTVHYQGCATKGLCYPPMRQEVVVTPLAVSDAISAESHHNKNDLLLPNPLMGSAVYHTLPFSPFWALLLGIGIAFTPCVLPMYPLIIGFLGGTQPQANRRRLSGLTFIYIQGMAFTYTLLGVLVAHLGLAFTAVLQNPYILISLSILFILLALSMFGIYPLALPSSLQTRLIQLTNRPKKGSILSALMMGMIAALICSPCTTAPLSAILLYISQSNSLLLGGILLYCYAFGMGIPLMIIALIGTKWLPRSGPWMEHLKEIVGFIILALPILLLERVISLPLVNLLWSLWSTTLFGWCFIIAIAYPTVLGRTMSTLLLMATIISGYNLATKIDHRLNPTQAVATTPAMITSLDELNLQRQKAKGKPVIIDFYADWCVACQRLTRMTLKNNKVNQALADSVLLTVDVTAMQSEQQALLDHFQIIGLPALRFYDRHGNEIKALQLNGFEVADDFLIRLAKLKEQTSLHQFAN